MYTNSMFLVSELQKTHFFDLATLGGLVPNRSESQFLNYYAVYVDVKFRRESIFHIFRMIWQLLSSLDQKVCVFF